MRDWLRVIGFIFVISNLSSCTIMTYTKGRMLRTPVDYRFKEFSDSLSALEYRVAVDDEISLQIYANDGYSFTSLVGGEGGVSVQPGQAMIYKVRSDSTVKVPILGKVKVVGFTMEELELFFEKRMADYFKSPFVIATIENRRVYLFSGLANASVVNLQNQNTTLFELLASGGGVAGGNASKIKIIRGDLKNPDIYKIDLSTIEGMQSANLTLQAGDIVYIDPIVNWASVVTSDITGSLGVISTALLIYSLFD